MRVYIYIRVDTPVDTYIYARTAGRARRAVVVTASNVDGLALVHTLNPAP